MSKRGIKRSSLKTAGEIAAISRSSSRASYQSNAGLDASYDKRSEDGRHSTGSQNKSGLVRKGSVKVTDLDAYMTNLAGKDRSTSAKDLRSNENVEESMPDLEEVVVQPNVTHPQLPCATEQKISDSALLKDNVSQEEIVKELVIPKYLGNKLDVDESEPTANKK